MITFCRAASSELLLFVECQEGLPADLTVSVRIAFLDHLADLLHGNFLFEVFGKGHDIRLRDVALLFDIDLVENSFDVFRLIVLAWLKCHHLYKLLEVDLTAQISVVDGKDLVYKSLLTFVATILHHCLTKVHRSEHAIVIGVEEVEDLLVHFDVAFCALRNNEFLRIEVLVSSRWAEG